MFSHLRSSLIFPLYAKRRRPPYIYVKKQSELGAAAGLGVKSAAAAIVEPGKGKEILDEIVQKIGSLK